MLRGREVLRKIWFFAVLMLCAIVFVGYNFERYYVQKMYPVHVFTACDPTRHSCFTADPASSDPTFQAGTYEKVQISAAAAPSCLDEHTCKNFSCAGVQGTCAITFCSKDNLETGESCTTSSP